MLKASLRRAFRTILGDSTSEEALRHAATHWALRDISFTLRPGMCLAVCGDNGSGKTTLLRTISGIYSPDEGSIQVRGRTSVLLSLGATLDTRLSGEQNLLISGAIHGLPASAMAEHISAVKQFAELDDDTLAMPVRYYSAGMRLRLAFSSASVLLPEILLIDEMLGVGDSGFREKSVAKLHELTAAARCVIICSHNLRFLREHCDRALWIHEGQLMAFGEAEDVLDRYAAHTRSRLNVTPPDTSPPPRLQTTQPT
jgi:ABC-type polysaccharide/polyol phosphate transport system ATPase subunit